MRPDAFVRSLRPFGGDEEDRTPDPLLAKQVLSQLSYTPIGFAGSLLFQGPDFSESSKLNNDPSFAFPC